MSALTNNRFLTTFLAASAIALFSTGCGDDTSGTGGSGNSGNTGNTGGDGGTGNLGGGGVGNEGGIGNAAGDGGGGNGGDGGGGGGACDLGAEATAISNNHENGNETPHTLATIPAGDIAAGAEMTYSLEMGGGNNLHSQDITVTAANFTELQAGTPVTVTSTSFGGMGGNMHTHDVTLTCITE